MKLEDLTHKKKTVSDLVRFIGNTAESSDDSSHIKTPNYSILLGAGASVTSGIRSGQTLIKNWKRDIFEEYRKRTDISDKILTIDEYFNSHNAPEWYEESNAYSALFENRFDLQRHRRTFVENEVSGKTPSIGYAYLVKLIENGYFNTIFTTNFDDLLNEAFYRFSKNRPIVCAHDSSISGVTVTSARPKIIKLHGDYLFENIKTTLRETESLETNMKLKFQEFAKDFGLIVVGYGGHDRSIMDILSYLLQQEDYFKNGIYWCIRKNETEVSPELKRLLWKDRAFYVEIDGFDEFFAELNHELNNGALPIDDAFLSRTHQESIIKDLTENIYIKNETNSKYLIEDCQKLRDHFEDNFANDFLTYVRNNKQSQSKENLNERAKRKRPYPALTTEQKDEVNNLIRQAFLFGHRSHVLDKLKEKQLFELPPCRYKLELLELEAELIPDISDSDIRKYFDELISLDPNNERYYEIASGRSRDLQQSLHYLEKANNIFVNDPYIINKYIDALLDDYEQNIDAPAENISLVEEKIKKSIELFPHIDNRAYILQARYNSIRYQNDLTKLEQAQNELCTLVEKEAKYHPNTLTILRLTNSSKLDEPLLLSSLDYYKTSDDDSIVEKVYLELIQWKEKHKSFDETLQTFREYEDNYIGSEEYKFKKAHILEQHEYCEDALKIFMSLVPNQNTNKHILFCYSYLNRLNEMDAFYKKIEHNDYYKATYLSYRSNYLDLVSYYQEKYARHKPTMVNDITNYAYALLQVKDYSNVQSLLKPLYDTPKYAKPAVIINYLFAKQEEKKGPKPYDARTKINEKLLENQYIHLEDEVKLGAYCVLGRKDDAYSMLRKVIKQQPTYKHDILHWPVIQKYVDEPKFKTLLAVNHFKINGQ